MAPGISFPAGSTQVAGAAAAVAQSAAKPHAPKRGPGTVADRVCRAGQNAARRQSRWLARGPAHPPACRRLPAQPSAAAKPSRRATTPRYHRPLPRGTVYGDRTAMRAWSCGPHAATRMTGPRRGRHSLSQSRCSRRATALHGARTAGGFMLSPPAMAVRWKWIWMAR